MTNYHRAIEFIASRIDNIESAKEQGRRGYTLYLLNDRSIENQVVQLLNDNGYNAIADGCGGVTIKF